MQDQDYMRLALNLAKEAEGRTSPNPLVGAVIVKEAEIVGTGYHHYAGGAHAEINALKEAGEQAIDATIYINLEPCSHYGKTPPCADALIKARVKKVIIAMEDPNPQVVGRGISKLKEAGIEVKLGVLEEEAKRLNEVFIKQIATQSPFVILKNAITLDGRVATKSGDSKWISGVESRQLVHKLRDRVDGILVGIGTVLADNPQLTTRLENGGRDPIRVILDSQLKISLDAQVITQKSKAKTIVATTVASDPIKQEQLKEKGVKIIVAGNGKRVEIPLLLKKLFALGITSLLVEGGSAVNTSFFEEKLVDKYYTFIAPKLIGGVNAVPVIGGLGVDKISEGVEISNKEVKLLGDDILVIGYPKY